MLIRNISKEIKGKDIKHAIAISCMGRKIVNIFDKEKEADIIKEHLSNNINFIGFYSYGEISHIKTKIGHKYNFYNNQTITMCLF